MVGHLGQGRPTEQEPGFRGPWPGSALALQEGLAKRWNRSARRRSIFRGTTTAKPRLMLSVVRSPHLGAHIFASRIARQAGSDCHVPRGGSWSHWSRPASSPEGPLSHPEGPVSRPYRHGDAQADARVDRRAPSARDSSGQERSAQCDFIDARYGELPEEEA